jgi:hypothetical protein
VLSERERRTLKRIERHLAESDPALAQVLSSGVPPRPLWANPTLLIVVGLALLVFGSVIVAVPVVVLGIALAVLAMFTAHRRPWVEPA